MSARALQAVATTTPADELDRGDFRLVDLPPGGTRSIPEDRLRMIAFAKSHKGHWVEYKPDPARDPVKLSTLDTSARKGNAGGFNGGVWNACIRGESVYVRYCGPRAAQS